MRIFPLRSLGSAPAPRMTAVDFGPLLALGQFVGLLEPLAGFVDGALGVVVGLDSLAVLGYGAVALAGDVKDLAQCDVAPDFGPAGFAVPAQGVAVGVDAGLA